MKIAVSNQDFGSSQILSFAINSPDGSRIARLEFSRKWVKIYRHNMKRPEKFTYGEFLTQIPKGPIG